MGKILISGGFSGTSLMGALLHRAGMQTGYSDQEVDEIMDRGKYCYDRLNPVLMSRHVPETQFKRAFERTVDPKKVHAR